jgi:epoxyqueuosine reductase
VTIVSRNIKNLITDKAKELGFVKAGFAKYEVLGNESERLRKWLDLGYDTDMEWIKKGFDKRKDIRLIMKDAKSVISLAYNYYTPFTHEEGKPKISRYAWGKDYHKVLKKKLKELCGFIEKTSPRPLLAKEGTKSSLPLNKGECPPACGTGRKDEGVKTKYYVDDGPVMDKVWAQRAGVGWMGKHTNIINPEYGSWLFLCEIITNIEFENYDSPIEDLCGSCSLCISACPTGAITDEYVVDANKCISYQTIENRGEIPESINLSGWIFGCDICQDVCPFNSPKYNHVTGDKSFYPSQELLSPPFKGDLGGFVIQTSPNPLLAKEGTKSEPATSKGFPTRAQLEAINEEEFNKVFADSPIKRTKFKGWRRNLNNFDM